MVDSRLLRVSVYARFSLCPLTLGSRRAETLMVDSRCRSSRPSLSSELASSLIERRPTMYAR